MPIFKTDSKLILYAHVPKCGGSAVSWYLRNRFGQIAFNDSTFISRPAPARWSRTSPQHIDRGSMARLFPDGFFDASFSIVRHPVSRIVSAYHFQMEQEKSISARVEFSDWLQDLEPMSEENPFLFDNHVRPTDDFVPESAHVFHMEHGLDQLVPWFDALTGRRDGPRAVKRINEKGRGRTGTVKVTPSAADLDRIARLYARDFARFGYDPGQKAPLAPAPVLPPDLIAERDAALKVINNPVRNITRKLGRRFGLKA